MNQAARALPGATPSAMEQEHEQHEAQLIAAAFVAFYDYAFTSHEIALPSTLIDLVAWNVRRRLNLSRAQAQQLLRCTEYPHCLPAALVLAYEVVGTHRVERQCGLGPGERVMLASIRGQCPLSLRGALALLTRAE